MNIEQVLEIARLYHEQNRTQEDIAKQLAVSRSTISRALKLARDRGYIRVVVVAPSANPHHLESWFYERFNLQHVTVVAGKGNAQEVLDSVGQAAATYLNHIMPDEGILTVSGGKTLFSISKQVRPAQRPNLSVVSVMGGWVGENAISANEVVREIAVRWNARADMLFAPAIVSDDIARQALLREDSIRLTLEKAKSATVACIGLAAITPGGDSQPYTSSSGRVSEEDYQRLLQFGAVGETCAQFFDIHGKPIESWNRKKTVAISIQDLKCMPTVVVVGTGVNKAPAFLGACRSGFITALIITEDLAAEIERLDQITR